MSSSLTSIPLEGTVGVRCVCIVPSSPEEENMSVGGRNHRFDVVIIGNSVGVVACHDCTDGSALWRARVGESPIHFIVSLGSERLLVGCGAGLIVVALHEGKVLGAPWRGDREHNYHERKRREENDAALVGVTLSGGILGWCLYCGFVSGTVRSYNANGSSNGPSLRVEGSGSVSAISLCESPSGSLSSFNGERYHTDDCVFVVVGTERGIVLVVDAVLNVLFKTRLGSTPDSMGLHATAVLSVHYFTPPNCAANGKVFAVSSEAGQISLFSNDRNVGWGLLRTLPAVHDVPVVSLSSCESILVDCLVSFDVQGIICVWDAAGSWALLARISTFSGTPFVKVLQATNSRSIVYAASVCGKLWDVGCVLTQRMEPARLVKTFSSLFPTNTRRYYAEYPHSFSVYRHTTISSTNREATAFELSSLISLIEEVEAFTRQEIECALLDAHRAHLMRWLTTRELGRSLSRDSDMRHGDGPIGYIGDLVPSSLLAAGQKLRCAESEATYWMRAFEASEHKRKKLLSDINAIRRPWEQMKMELSHREAELSDVLFSREQERAELLSQIQTLREEVASRGRL